MTINVKGGEILGSVDAIPSKSYAHRIIICNFLAGNNPECDLRGFTSKDISATLGCIKALLKGEKDLFCGESGSTLRFMLPLCASLGGEYNFFGQGKLMERPNEELFSVLASHGVKVKKTDKITISGKLTPGEYVIRGDISSQYVSGLLMALPMLDGDSEIVLTTPLQSKPYVDITTEVLGGYGVSVLEKPNGFWVKGNQKYKGSLIPEGDWSNSAFFLVLGAIKGKVTIKGLNNDSVQGDRAIIDVLKLFGADVIERDNLVTVSKGKFNPFTVDCRNCPDLVPIIAVLGSMANGKTVIKNIERLKIKESDRIQSTITTLSAFGVKIENQGNDLIVYGGDKKSCTIDSFNDHRIVMSGAVLACALDSYSAIERAEAVEKSYPNFFNDLSALGGKVSYER